MVILRPVILPRSPPRTSQGPAGTVCHTRKNAKRSKEFFGLFFRLTCHNQAFFPLLIFDITALRNPLSEQLSTFSTGFSTLVFPLILLTFFTFLPYFSKPAIGICRRSEARIILYIKRRSALAAACRRISRFSRNASPGLPVSVTGRPGFSQIIRFPEATPRRAPYAPRSRKNVRPGSFQTRFGSPVPPRSAR